MKILIISHTPISTFNNMGKTFMSLFAGFEKNELCQLYIYPSYPNVDFCSSYYRVTDKDVLKTFMRFYSPGVVVSKDKIKSDQGMYEHSDDVNIYRNQKNKSPSCRLLRDIAWKFCPWYNRALKDWLAQEKPTCIFLAPGTAKFIYDIALSISKRLNIPLVTYICDDYYFNSSAHGVLGKLQHSLLKRKIKQTLSLSSHLVVICNELCKAYSSKFHIPCTTVMTGASFPPARMCKNTSAPTTISYFGNVRCNRYLSLLDVGMALKDINNRLQTDYKLLVYTAEQDQTILDSLRSVDTISVQNFLTGDAYTKKLLSSDILLHTEGFDDWSIGRVRFSFSTKIPDCLSSGLPFVAYGPASVASVSYLLEKKCAHVITSRAELSESLANMFADVDYRNKFVPAALQIASTCHTSNSNSALLYECISYLHKIYYCKK